MSGRFQTHTVASEGVELDENYQKTVADIEEQTQRSGWLFGRGAFDKGELQYLRDFNKSLRYMEVEIEDKEKELWERERARVEAEAATAAAAAAAQQQVAALTRRSSGGSAAGAPLLRGPGSLSSRPAPLLLPVKVKPAGSRQAATPRQQQPTSPSAAAADSPSCKRARTDSTAAALAAGGALRSARSEPSPAGPSLRSTLSALAGSAAVGQTDPHLGRQHQGPAARSQSQPDVAGGDVAAAIGVSAAGSKSSDGSGGAAAAPAGLANLLGGYGSDDDNDEDGVDGSGRGDDSGGGDCSGGGGLGSTGAGPNGTGAGHSGDGAGRNGGNGGDGGGGGAGGDSNAGRPGLGKVGAKLPPPVGLLSPEELLADPRVISEGLLATRPQPQNVQGGDAWDSEDAASGSDSDA